LWVSTVDVHVSAGAGQHGKNGLIEHAKEDTDQEEGDEGNEDKWEVWVCHSLCGLGDMLHEQPGKESVENSDSNFTEKDEDESKIVSESKFSTMLEVQNKSVISGGAEALTGNSHESIGSLIDIFHDFLKAFKEALDKARYAFD
jgi:hypothetical protein